MRFWLYLTAFISTTTQANSFTSAASPALDSPFSSDSLLQMLLGLGLVIGLILVLSWLLRRVAGLSPINKELSILGVLPLSSREKVVLIKAGKKQLLLGVASGRVSLLESFSEPVIELPTNKKTFSERFNQVTQKQKETQSSD